MSDANTRIKLHEAEETRNATESLQQSNEELLRTIFIVSADKDRNDDTARISRTIAYFSSLLVSLSKQAEESTNKTAKLTKQVLDLTWFIAVLTTILLLLGFLQFMK